MRNFRVPALAATLLFASLAQPGAPSQILERVIPVSGGDPNLADHPFGMVLDPDGIHAYVAIAGLLPPFTAPPSQWSNYNNRRIAKIDLHAGLQVATGQVGDYPEEIALTLDGAGQTRHVYVANGSAGTVTCLAPDLSHVATINLSPCGGSLYASVFPFGILASPDGSRVYAQGTSCGTMDVIDSDPASSAFNTVIQSHLVPNMFGRLAWAVPGQVIVTPFTEYHFNPVLGFFDGSTTGIATLDVLTGATAAHVLVGFSQFAYPSITDLAVMPNGRVLTAVGFGIEPLVIDADPSTGIIHQQLNLVGIVGETLHGLALSPDGRRAVATAINNNMEIVFLRTQPLALSSIVPTIGPGGPLPNEAVFTRDGSQVAVTFQGLAEVRVYGELPDMILDLHAPQSAAVGAPFPVAFSGLEWGRPVVLFASLGAGPQIVGTHTVHLSNPFHPVYTGLGDIDGLDAFTAALPADPAWIGITLHLQAGTTDRSGRVRLSGGASLLAQ